MKNKLVQGWDKLQARSSLMLLIVAAAVIEVMSVGQYIFSRNGIRHEVEQRARTEIKLKNMEIQNVISDVEVAVNNMQWLIDWAAANPDSIYSTLQLIINNNPIITGCAMAFEPNHFPSKGAFQRTLRSPLCYDISITRAIQHYHGRSASPRSRVIYNGIRSAREKAEPHEVGSYFLYVGRIEPQKGFLLLAEAYADYFVKAANPLPLKVAGAIADKHYRQQADALFQRCGAQTLVTYLGQRDDIPTLMREARALVVTSQNEAFGRVMPEAMFAGCPVIACDKAGTHEQIQNGLSQQGADIALPFTTADELTSHLLTATLSPESLTPMAARALSTVRQLYTWECNVAATIDFYNEIINHKKTP